MKTFKFSETQPCLVTFYNEVEAENEAEAWEALHNGDYKYMGFNMGDCLRSPEAVRDLVAEFPHITYGT